MIYKNWMESEDLLFLTRVKSSSYPSGSVIWHLEFANFSCAFNYRRLAFSCSAYFFEFGFAVRTCALVVVKSVKPFVFFIWFGVEAIDSDFRFKSVNCYLSLVNLLGFNHLGLHKWHWCAFLLHDWRWLNNSWWLWKEKVVQLIPWEAINLVQVWWEWLGCTFYASISFTLGLGLLLF